MSYKLLFICLILLLKNELLSCNFFVNTLEDTFLFFSCFFRTFVRSSDLFVVWFIAENYRVSVKRKWFFVCAVQGDGFREHMRGDGVIIVYLFKKYRKELKKWIMVKSIRQAGHMLPELIVQKQREISSPYTPSYLAEIMPKSLLIYAILLNFIAVRVTLNHL